MTKVEFQTTLFARIKEALIISFGLILYGCAWNMFILSQGFVGGGVGGICAMIYYLTGIPVFATYFGINLVLVIIAYLVMGREFSIKTVLGIIGVVLVLYFIPIPEKPVIQDKLLSAIMGGVLVGSGVGVYLLQGASTGGSDIIAMIISKYKNVSLGRIYLIFDACVISYSALLPDRSLETVAYGFVVLGVSAYVVDMVHSGAKQTVQLLIFTNRYQEISDSIIHLHRRGVTLFESIGWYTKTHKKTIFLVARKREMQGIFRTVKQIDEHAFVVVSNAMSVFGMGFDVIKTGFSKLPKHMAEIKPSASDEVQPLPLTEDALIAHQDKIIGDDELLRDKREAEQRELLGLARQYNPNWPQSSPATHELSHDATAPVDSQVLAAVPESLLASIPLETPIEEASMGLQSIPVEIPRSEQSEKLLS